MSIPVMTVLGFAGWTLVILFASVGVYRWGRILTGRARIEQFRADQIDGEDWYRRAMRAHANCIENLPILIAIVVTINAVGITSRALDGLALTVILARMPQSLVHILLRESTTSVSVRFGLYFIQVIAMLAMIAIIFLEAF